VQAKIKELEAQSLSNVKKMKEMERKIADLQGTKDKAEFSVRKHRENLQQNMPGAAAKVKIQPSAHMSVWRNFTSLSCLHDVLP
jgi:hypothetical protein